MEHFNQFLETVRATLQPEPRALSTASTLEQEAKRLEVQP